MPAACRISHTVDGATVRPSFVSSSWIRRYPQQRILLRQPDDYAGDARGRRWSPGLAPFPRVVPLRGQSVVPGQQRRWRDGEDLGPAPAGQEPGQRGEAHPVGRLVSHPADVAAQHRVLMPEHQQLSGFRSVAAERQDSHTEEPARQQVGDLEQHPASQPASSPLVIAQVGRSIEYSSGTGCGRSSRPQPARNRSPPPRLEPGPTRGLKCHSCPRLQTTDQLQVRLHP